MSHWHWAQEQGVWRASRTCVICMLCVAWFSTTFPSTPCFPSSSLIFLFILLIIFIFHVGDKNPAHSCEWGVRQKAENILSHFAQNTDVHMSGKNGATPRMNKNGKTITCIMDNFVPFVVPGLSSSSSSSSASASRPKDQSKSSGKSEASSDPMTTRSAMHACVKPMQTNPDKQASGSRGSEHTEDEMDEEDPLRWCFKSGDTKTEAQYLFSLPQRPKFRHMPENQITRVPCWRRIEGSIPRAEKFGELATADHKVLSEGCESRNNHPYAVVVQDLATQWIQSYPCKNKNSQETEKSPRKFPEPSQKPTHIYMGISLEFGKSCEELTWNHRTSTPYRSETNGMQNELYVECISRIIAIWIEWKMLVRFYAKLLLSAKCPRSRGRRERETQLEFINSERKYYKESFQGMLWSPWEFGRETFWLLISKTENLYFLWQMVQQHYQEETMNSKNPLWDRKERESRRRISRR